ncbi:MAG: cofactor-independent phosphoglycerate mutase [Marinilabiliaceae bacterium]|nr:cofactor-independent phosphoglycerate mutase [Marinilabiliaceae bacterium]
MKYLVVLADGLADEPISELNGLTPVMAAKTPNIDKLCSMSRLGLFKTVPDTLHPGSEVANMTVMGYDAEKFFNGRGVLEAAAMGVELDDTDMAFRCNLISIHDEKILNHSGGHISTEDAGVLIDVLNTELGSDVVKFYKGVSYRHLLVIKNGKGQIQCTPPHDVPGALVTDVLPTAQNVESKSIVSFVNELIAKSRSILESHPINIQRANNGKPKANSIWPWSPGYRPQMPTMNELYGLEKGAVISAVDLIHGIGAYAGLKSIHVEGATGLFDTNYEGKAMAAIEAVKDNDYVYLHIEASDEAGHEGDFMLKIKTIEDIDKKVMKPIIEQLVEGRDDVTIAFLPDHPTPCKLRTHTRDAIPFYIYRPDGKTDGINVYNEQSAKEGSYGVLKGTEFMNVFINDNK